MGGRKADTLNSQRLEAFSDAVIAIIITIMVLELHAPRQVELDALLPLLPSIVSYILSFIYLAIYWNNHHHLFQAVEKVNGPVLWANMHLLFWLSVIPFTTSWIGTTEFALWPVVLYGVNLLMAAIAYFFLTLALVSCHGTDSLVARALGKDLKGKVSVVIYLAGIAGAFVSSWIAGGLYVVVAIIWLIPDRRMERVLEQ